MNVYGLKSSVLLPHNPPACYSHLTIRRLEYRIPSKIQLEVDPCALMYESSFRMVVWSCAPQTPQALPLLRSQGHSQATLHMNQEIGSSPSGTPECAQSSLIYGHSKTIISGNSGQQSAATALTGLTRCACTVSGCVTSAEELDDKGQDDYEHPC